MPRFYFDIVLGTVSSRDEAGHEIDSLQAAEIEALRTAGELARDQLFDLQNAIPGAIRVEVRDKHRQPVLTVTVSIQVERAGLTPPSSP